MKKITWIFTLLALASVMAFAAGQQQSDSKQDATVVPITTVNSSTATTSMKYGEAPELTELVKTGKIPAVEQRLPKEPMVVTNVPEIGQYGGTWRMVSIGASDRMQLAYKNMEHLGRWNDAFTEVLPSFAKKWELLDGGKTIVISLREGTRWSDGELYTTEDIRFFWEDVLKFPDLKMAQSLYSVNGQLGELKIIDKNTFSITWQSPNYTFPELFYSYEFSMIYYPAHYLKQFHPKYTEKTKIDEAMKKAGFTVWTEYFNDITRLWNNPGTPTIDAWVVENKNDQAVQLLKRNPYYWKVDKSGNQLPYINEQRRTLLPDAQAMLLKALAGEVDYQSRRLAGVDNRPIAVQNQEKGDYTIVNLKGTGENAEVIMFNYFQEDSYKANLYMKKDFRVALSLAINRKEMNDVLVMGLGNPGNSIVGPQHPLYDQAIADKYAVYDPVQANKLLDGLGLTKKDSEGYRLRTDTGKRLSLELGTPGETMPKRGHEMIKEYWKQVGIELNVVYRERTLWHEVRTAYKFDLTSFNALAATFGGPSYSFAPQYYFAHSDYTYHGQKWADWVMSDGKKGVEPPPDLKPSIQRLYAIYKAIPTTPTSSERMKLEKEMLQIEADSMFMIGTYNMPAIGFYAFVKNSMRNIPSTLVTQQRDTCAWYIKK